MCLFLFFDLIKILVLCNDLLTSRLLLGLKRFTLDCSCCKTFSAPPIMSPNHESPPDDDFTKVQSNAMKTTSIFLKIVQQ